MSRIAPRGEGLARGRVTALRQGIPYPRSDQSDVTDSWFALRIDTAAATAPSALRSEHFDWNVNWALNWNVNCARKIIDHCAQTAH
jgi:hypothetical protein